MKFKQYLKKRKTRKTNKNRKNKKGGSGRGTRKSSSTATFQSIERYNKLTNQIKDQIQNNDKDIQTILSTKQDISKVLKKTNSSNDKRILEKTTNELIQLINNIEKDNKKLKRSLKNKSYLKGKTIVF